MNSLIFLSCIFIVVKSINAGCFVHLNEEDCRYKNFFDFGTGAGDKNLSKYDDHFAFIRKPANFKFYNRYFSAIFISTNGVVNLIEKNETFKLHEQFNFNSVPFPLADHTIVAPFWTDLIPDSDGEIFYRVTSDPELQTQVSYEIDRLKPSHGSSFMPAWSCIVTWYQLKAFNHRRFHYNNTFQLVLTTDGEKSYVMFNYGRLDWPNSKVQTYVVVGYNLGDNKTHYQMNFSREHSATELQHKSNVGVRAKWIYRVDMHKDEIVKAEHAAAVKAKNMDTTSLSVLIFLVILVGINSCFSTVMWAHKFYKQFKNRPRGHLSYNKHLNDSQIGLNQNI